MFFPRLTTLLPLVLLSSAISSFAAPAPVTQGLIVKRQEGVVAVLQNLKDATAEILVSTQALVDGGNLNDITGASQATKLISALTLGGNTITGLTGGVSKRELVVRQADPLAPLNQVVAELIVEIIKDVSAIVVILQGLPLLGGLLIGIDAALAVVLTGVGILLQGVLQLVGQLLGNLSVVLLELGAGLSAGLLGLIPTAA